MSKVTGYRAEDAKRLKALIRQWQDRRRANGAPSTLRDLGVMVGVTQPAVTQFQTGSAPLSKDTVARFARALEVSPWEISPRLARDIDHDHIAGHAHAPAAGMVYEWHEATAIASGYGVDMLPQVFSIEIAEGRGLGAMLMPHDIIVVSRTQAPGAGDGVLVLSRGQLSTAVAWPSEDGIVLQVLSGVITRIDAETRVVGTVVGMPTLRLGRLTCYASAG